MLASKLSTIQPGTIGTVAGMGEPGRGGDGGPAVIASLNEPKSIALDEAAAVLYIADSENHLIRRIDLATGIMTTVVGSVEGDDRAGGASGSTPVASVPVQDEDPLGDLPGSGEERFAQVADLSGMVRFVVGTGPGTKGVHGDGGPATAAALNFPSAVAVDDGTLYIADTMNHRVRKVDLHSGLITTIAGTGQHRLSGDGGPAVSATLNEPCALVLDGKGNLYIADQSNNRVRRVDLVSGVITTLAGTGEAVYGGDGMPATEAALAGPSGLAIGPDGALYIADTFNGRIRRVDLESGIISTVAGDGGPYRYQGVPNEFSTSLSRPYGIAIDRNGNILITDSDSHLIRRWDCKKKIILALAGNGVAQFAGDGGPPSESSLNFPFGVAVDAQSTIYIADTFNHRIRKIAA